MKGKRFLSVILVIVMIIEIISQMFFKEVLAVENTNNEMNSETTEETAEEQASEEQTSEEIGREYEIKEEETWDISENGDGSVIAKWTLSDKTLRISGNGEMKDWINYEKEDWHNSKYTNIIENVVIEDGVTNIGDWAFSECSNLIDIKISERVTEIGRDAFWECSSLTSINIPNGVTTIKSETFYNCSSLESIRIPEEVTEIGDYTFYGCSSLISIVIPQNVNLIDYRAFTKCNSLENINVDTNNRNYMSENGILFSKDKTEIITYPAGKDDIKVYQIPEGITEIGGNAFRGCSSLINIEIPEEVTSIGNGAFEGCSSLTNIEIPEEVTIIGNSTFEGCSSLTNIEIPEGVTEIGWGAFSECNSLISINIPKDVTTIKNGTFKDCSSLINIEIPKGLTKIERFAFERCSSLAKIEIPESVTEIEVGTFSECSSLTNIEIPEGITKIEDYVFEGCSSLVNIEISESVTEIGDYAFSRCSKLTSINIPKSVTTIGEDSFSECNKLIIYIEGDSVGHKYAEENKIGYILNGEASTIPTEYEVKEEETWDISENEDGSVMAEWTLSNKTLRIFGNGKMRFWNQYTYEKEDWHNSQYTNLIEKVTIEEDITNIGGYAFAQCSSLTSINIPEGVRTIRESTFYECSNLTNIEIPEGVTEIGDHAFEGCSNLVNINIPEGVTKIEMYAFEGCSSLAKIEIPEKVTKIEEGTFWKCSSLTNIEIPEGIAEIGDYAFLECSNLEAINVNENNKNYMSENGILFNKERTMLLKYPDNKKDINEYKIPENVTSIEERAFAQCSNLTSIEIPEGVTEIGNYAFEGCNSLISINIPNDVTTIESGTFERCSSLVNIEIPDNVTIIEGYAFSECSSLASIKIPERVTEIGREAFEGCSSLTNIEIPDSVTSIGVDAFSRCNNINEVLLSENVTNIEDDAIDKNITIYTTPNSTAHKYAEENEQGYIIDEKGPDINILIDRIITNQKQTLTIPVEVKDNYEFVGVKEGTIKYAISDSNTQAPSDEEFINDVIDGKIIYEMQEGKKYIWVRAEDNLGNVSKAVSQELNLDLIAPKLEVSKMPTEKTNQKVTVSIKADEEIQKPEGWQLSSDQKTITKEYTDNIEEIVTIKDLAGNETKQTITIDNIDKTAPEVEIIYSTKEETEGSVIVEIQANEELQSLAGWNLSTDKKKLTKKYSRNTKETVIVKDIAGNEKQVEINIQNIKTPIKIGDINADSKIDITDIILLKRHLIAENRTNWILTGDNLEAADMNENEKVDISDLLLLKREVAQNI